MEESHVKVAHPLWNSLLDLDNIAAERFPSRFDPGFGSLGLRLFRELEHYEYWCTPTNTLTFACTGGDGVHFSFLVRDAKITAESPIVITRPMEYGEPNVIGGESLFDFLCLGYFRGYFALEAMPSESAFAAFESADWQPKAEWEFALGLGVDANKRKLLDFLTTELGLSPWKDLKRKFADLQNRYMPLLEMPEEEDGLA